MIDKSWPIVGIIVLSTVRLFGHIMSCLRKMFLCVLFADVWLEKSMSRRHRHSRP